MKTGYPKFNTKKLFVSLLITLVLNCYYTNAQNNDTDSLQTIKQKEKRFSIGLGGFLTNYNSGISLGSEQLGVGIHLDLEDALGLKTSTIAFRGNINYSFGKNLTHTLSFGYFNIFRNASKVLDTELEVGDLFFPVGTEINSKFNLTILRAKYDYSFLKTKTVSLGASFGFFIMPISFSVTALASEGGATDLVAPLPVLGLRSNFHITKKLYLRQSVEILLLKIDNFQGSILDLDILLEHKTFKNISFGLGINSNNLNIKAEGGDYPSINFFGEIGMGYTGMYIFAKYYF